MIEALKNIIQEKNISYSHLNAVLGFNVSEVLSRELSQISLKEFDKIFTYVVNYNNKPAKSNVNKNDIKLLHH